MSCVEETVRVKRLLEGLRALVLAMLENIDGRCRLLRETAEILAEIDRVYWRLVDYLHAQSGFKRRTRQIIESVIEG